MPAQSINTQVIRDAASTIQQQNNDLYEELMASNQTVASLSGVWTGEGADATRSTYNQFATKYAAEYQEMLNNYVRFLNEAAGQGYEDTERSVTSAASEI